MSGSHRNRWDGEPLKQTQYLSPSRRIPTFFLPTDHCRIKGRHRCLNRWETRWNWQLTSCRIYNHRGKHQHGIYCNRSPWLMSPRTHGVFWMTDRKHRKPRGTMTTRSFHPPWIIISQSPLFGQHRSVWWVCGLPLVWSTPLRRSGLKWAS